jgi:hypothetical protein
MFLAFLAGLYYCESVPAFQGETVTRHQYPALSESLDKSILALYSVKDNLYTHNVIAWQLKNLNHYDSFSELDYIQMGKVMAIALQEEISFNSYYMAHLMDHQKYKANADLQFDTYYTNWNALE